MYPNRRTFQVRKPPCVGPTSTTLASTCEAIVTRIAPDIAPVARAARHRAFVVTEPVPALVVLAERLAALAGERVRPDIPGDDARRRARQLHDHVVGHVLPRARSLDAPLLVLLIGPTGAGKSSVLNALAGRRVSPSGVLRPTTRELVVLVRPEGRPALVAAAGATLPVLAGSRLRIIEDAGVPAGIALIDAPDVDSIEHANRDLTDRLAEAADLGLFVTTATRYADRVPWEVLVRARDRGLPLVVVVNRVPANARAAVLQDVARLLREFGVVPRGLAAASTEPGASAGPPTNRGPIDLLAIPEGALDPLTDGVEKTTVAPIRARIDALGADRDARRALASRALAGGLAGLAPLVERVADDCEHEAIEADALRRVASGAFSTELDGLRADLQHGTFLRAEALRQWQAFVGADEITRLFSSGIGRIRGTLSAVLRGTPRAPVAEVREEAIADIVTLARTRAADAARRTAAAWATEPATRDALTADPGLWTASPDFDRRLHAALEGWVVAIAADVSRTGGAKRTLARGASLGVNTAGIGVMLATFAHTGGLTGAEVGVAAATGFLNQKLLEALFGEAALVEMIGRARRRLDDALREAFEAELGRFEARVVDGSGLRDLAHRLRASASDISTFQPLQGVVGAGRIGAAP